MGLPGDLSEAIAREIQAHIPGCDKSRAFLCAQDILKTFYRHLEFAVESEEKE